MISFNLTILTRATPFTQRQAKTRKIFPTKTLQNFTRFSSIVSTFIQSSHSISKKISSTMALRHFKRKAMAEMNSQFTINEDQEMETQLIYLSSDDIEIASACPSPIRQLRNNVPDTYSAITQPKAAQHEQMLSSSIFKQVCRTISNHPANFVNLR